MRLARSWLYRGWNKHGSCRFRPFTVPGSAIMCRESGHSVLAQQIADKTKNDKKSQCGHSKIQPWSAFHLKSLLGNNYRSLPQNPFYRPPHKIQRTTNADGRCPQGLSKRVRRPIVSAGGGPALTGVVRQQPGGSFGAKRPLSAAVKTNFAASGNKGSINPPTSLFPTYRRQT